MTAASIDAPAHAAGTPPKNSTDSVVVSFGMLPISLSVYKGVDDATAPVRRHTYNTAGNPVGTKKYDKVTGLDVANEDVVMLATASDGETTVELTNEEIVAITGGSMAETSIECFIPLQSLIDGTYVIEGLKQVRPKRLESKSKKVENVGAGKALTVLLAGLQAEGVAALVKVAFGSAARYAALLPDGHLAMLAFSKQVKAPLPLPEYTPAEAEMAMARQLIHNIGISTPPLVDAAGPALQDFVDAKAAGEVVTDVKPVVAAAPEVDLMAAMAASMGIAVPAEEEAAPPAVFGTFPPVVEVETPVEDEPVETPKPVGLGSIYKTMQRLSEAS